MTTSTYYLAARYSGRVQGVGFRYQVLQIAKGFDVSGQVKNLADGRVLLEAEGEEGEVEAFGAEIEEQMAPFIREVERDGQHRSAEFSGFTIG